MNSYVAELWTHMIEKEWDFLAPHEPNWRTNWYEVSSELRDRLNRLNDYQSEGLSCTEISGAQALLVRYEADITSTDQGLDTPQASPPPVRRPDGWMDERLGH